MSLTTFMIDVIFAAIAGLGFSYANNPPKRILLYCALLGGLGYALRLTLLETNILNYAGATLVGSISIGLFAVYFAKKLKTPIEVIAFPSLLPMIPGIQAYKTILAIFIFMRSKDENEKIHYLLEIFDNAYTAISIIFALATGISIVLLIFYEKSFVMTRNGHFREKYKDILGRQNENTNIL
ncbi:MAG: threonine/serine exporter family protein [Campylobacter sputorum]|uniref:threonine/serine exporter family protein n=2 Tax=Campylobacter sputorum TaxID=206 RepID=UPI000B779E26|nr:threonine/serine exporter family protein [Campylobacter sputorum]ASM38931.1 hypothetical membrane protein (DUF3815 domain) [Campylobacter sputorum bv. paraureolyticus LMG 11764]MDY6121174.1 threonine/serine exporter family protein [Campylobacter sputorum]